MFQFQAVHAYPVAADTQINTKLFKDLLGSDAFQEFIKQYNLALTAFLGFSTITCIVVLFANITKLSAAADNDFRRREAINGILVCLVCLALIGGIDIVYAILLSFVFSF